ncbi:MAG: pantoate--beta-alanine ligase [Armatimonadetes bacterium]|nr:pantoate--beta-alanine ligase [Armatimonadota bacterium]NIM24310.1 pantoate--beta-alanine ligase [Armatimonadota bacterium]NIM68179.1 pantoate--beta-alanine ligase [Armatimonadota bacterium]NIM76639.1 pantoate--beta-alanine ligase [Armatimonadota bacterium]NIN06384.1 pantoate--beta-alanine ligase [Armatimonadota bacterium]
MEIIERVGEVRHRLAEIRRASRPIVFVPTMGAFHEGHIELMRRAKAGQDAALSGTVSPYLVVSIFVNPTQFGPGEDYRSYPRDMQGDLEKAREAGADLIFTPSVEEMYPGRHLSAIALAEADSTTVEVGKLAEGMCGSHRPGHFRGMATVVCKLFNIIQPDAAYFGEKDYQQLKIIQRMVEDLQMPVKIVPISTVREPDGLAMSSRNAYLSAEERRAAAFLHKGLKATATLFEKGERNAAALIEEAKQVIAAEPLLRLQYIELRDADTLQPLQTVKGNAVLALAAQIGKARLIDNIILRVS